MQEIKLNGQTLNIVEENIQKLKQIFPEVFNEGKIDFEKLQNVLGNYIDMRNERYNFNWHGKANALRLSQTPSTGTLRPCKEESKNWDTTKNLYIEGDNLEVLKLLQKTYHNKIKMIYIDPPYNTGNDFVYQDDFRDSIENYKKTTGMIDDAGNNISSNSNTSGRYHTDWLNMIYPRLRLARNLLRDDGTIFISIDDNEMENLRKICDEIFGEDNFIGLITVLNNPKGRSQDKYIATCHEYLIIYSKTLLIKGAVSIPKSKEDIEKDYPLVDEKGNIYRELELRNTHREFGKFNRPNLYYPLYVYKDGRVSTEYNERTSEVYPIWEDGFEGCWTWGKEKAEAEIRLLFGKLINEKWKIFRKAYAIIGGEAPLKQVKSILLNKDFYTEKGQAGFNELFRAKEKYFNAPKSIEYIKNAIAMSQAKNHDVILDFFAGSSTTAHAVMKLNAEDGRQRKFIMIQLPESCDEKSEAYKVGYKNICEIGKERIRRAGEKIKEENAAKDGVLNLDIGFKVLKLDSSNMKKWNPNDENLEQSLLEYIDNYKKGRTELDVVYEIMLKYGIDLTYPVEEYHISNKNIYSIGAGALLICLDDEITSEIAQEILYLKEKLNPENVEIHVVFKDNGFKDDSNKTNIKEILKCGGVQKFITI